MTEGTGQEAQLPVVWAENEEVRALLANQFLGQLGPQGEVLLTFGQLVPPALLGGREQVAKQLEQYPYLSVKPISRIAITRFGLDEMIWVLEETRDNYDRAQRAAEDAQKGGEA